ncbi:NAD-dependent epimerase/dehydratase family protein [Dethiobacter alkaliphilus]|uniref:NAD-dependent epimerase/dehydratase family protein n=1 Tax=Dethiobacter alkaliphilus TaxID=427926 RepID=UPI0022275FB5|nr:NAD-dependent epimerase/dehydratase family protein [Dethiobacter alkaliphilus]MCW3489906.1 NAD-dependent epimerase/dehydratase family protein [Dethiobacter alkaliphilus]
MKYLVTGAAGFVGSHLCTSLLSEGNEVWGIDDLSSGKEENIEHLKDNPRFYFIEGCISDESQLLKLIYKVDIIYHLAAVVGVKHYVEDPTRVIDVNVCYTSSLLENAWKLGKKVVFTSTSEVYGKSESIPFAEEDDRVYGPASTNRWCYAISKSAGEYLCLGYAKQGLPVVILRYFNVYGPRADDSAYGGVTTRFINQALAGTPLTVHGDGAQTRCFTYIDDIVKATMEAGKRPEAEGRIFNLGREHETPILELAKMVLKVSGTEGEIVFQPYKEFYGSSYEDIRRRIPDLSAARQILGYNPSVTLEEGIRETLNWYRNRNNRSD